MKISIIGAGNGGQAMAGHFALLGHEVCLYNRSAKRIEHLCQSNEIKLMEALSGSARITKLTCDLEEAINFANLIMITSTADAHHDLANSMAEFLRDGQTIVLNPGRTLGAYEFSTIVRNKTNKSVTIAEAQSLIYACRVESPGTVRVIGVKEHVLLAAWPATDTDHVLHTLNAIYPCFVKAENVLLTSLENIGAIFHPAVVMFNAATIERGQGFYFYNDMTPAIADFLEQLDIERLNIGKAFGINLKPAVEWVSFAYKEIQGNTLCEKMRNNPAYFKILAPAKLHSRLLLEDIPTGILPFIELAGMVGVKVPLMESVFNVSQALLKTDFRKTGRSLERLGLKGVSAKDFLKRL
jgi:opine dehydrogenase